jgi:short-subunit dehydrogenase
MGNIKGLIVITGVSKGIGKALALKFLSQGFDVVGCSRGKESLDKLSDEANAISNAKLFTYSADLSDKSQVLAFADYVKSFNRPVEVLINNTGVFVPGQVHNEPDGMLELQIQTNLYSAYYLTRALVPQMIANKHGHIFMMCSIASIIAYPNGGAYTISKFALYGMTKVLREELKPHDIRVTAILPGATYTTSWEGAPFPEDRFVKASDVADTVWGAYSLSQNAVVEEIVIRPQLGDIN